MPEYPLIVTGKNYNKNNKKFVYQFDRGSITLDKHEVSLSEVFIYNSFFNVSDQYNNRVFTLRVPVSGGYEYVKMELKPGYYSIEDINKYIQSYLIENGQYLINSQGQNVFYIEIVVNKAYYRTEIRNYVHPTQLPSGWKQPSPEFAFSTAQNQVFPVITIGDSNNFGQLLGFNPGTYPMSSIDNEYPGTELGQSTPQINPISSILIHCNLVNNIIANRSQLLYAFTSNTSSIGEMIEVRPTEHTYIPISPSVYQYLEIYFTDQDNNYLEINDFDILIMIIIKSA